MSNSDKPPDQWGAAIVRWLEERDQGLLGMLAGFARVYAHMAGFARTLRGYFDARMEVYPELRRRALALGKEGWFLSTYFRIQQLDEVARQATSGDAQRLEQVVFGLYRESIVEHLDAIVEEYPDRAFALRPAVDAHLRGEYALSVPVFFAHADGICSRMADKNLFSGKAPERVAHLAQTELAAMSATPARNSVLSFYAFLTEIMWTSVSENLPIAYNPSDREKHTYTGLNRNTVLHGIALEEYATEENSLKAFSLLSCIAALMSARAGAVQDANDKEAEE